MNPQPELPWCGVTPQSRHASWTGAVSAVECLAEKQSAYLQLLRTAGSLTDQEAAALLQWPLSSVNSTRNSVRDLIVADGFETAAWTGRRSTRRTKWRLRRSGE